MRVQIHQYGDLIAGATRDQKRLQAEIAKYQGRISLSPAVEEQYKELTRDYDNANKNYQDLLAKKSIANLTVKMTIPNRLLFAGGGLGAGLAIGLGLAMWLELRDKAIRTVSDAEAVLELPTLVAVPWVGVDTSQATHRKWKVWSRNKGPAEPKAAIEL